jgi:phosphate acyltransferase
LKEALTSGPFSMVGALLASSGLKKLKTRMDPNSVNGGVFLGLNGLVIKSHGGTNATGFASAMEVALKLAASSYMAEVQANLTRLVEARKSETRSSDPAQSLSVQEA